tara:strand:+ start:24639 stop:25361 length:723 start_codon:yes stop_codon:yes gene_type:complete
MFRNLRNAFLTGVVLLLPLGVTYIVVNFIIVKIGVPASEVFFWYVDDGIRSVTLLNTVLNVLALFALIIFIIGLGFFSRYVLGRIVISMVERILDRLPFVNSVYRTVKQIVDTFSQQQKAVFQEVVLVEYPRKGSWVLGFRTSESKGEVQAKTGLHLSNIFVPTTPNPTSGFLLMIPTSEIIPLEMSVADGMKVIISGGAVTPTYHPKNTAEQAQIVAESPHPIEESPEVNEETRATPSN